MQSGFTFHDDENGSAAYCCVRLVGTSVGVATSLESGGDLEVFLPVAEARRLAA